MIIHHRVPADRPLRNFFVAATAAFFVTAMVPLRADIVKTRDGASLVGVIKRIEEGKIYLETVYAGEITVDKGEVVGITTDDPVFLRLASGATMSGKVEAAADGGVRIESEDGVLSTNMDRVVSSWAFGAEDPQVVQLREEAEKNRPKWGYEVAVDLTGKSGNTDKTGTALRFTATRAGPDDSLKFYGSYDQAETDGIKSANEIKGGIEYNSFFQKKLGWFVRGEMENDEFETLDFRATVAGGLSYRFKDSERQRLLGRAGFSYRFESFSDGREIEALGGDFGLNHFYRFKEWGKVITDLQFIPSIEDLSDYRFAHDTAFEIPLGGSQAWKLRIGLSNFLNSNPAPGRVKLDTTYYTRLVLSFQ
jgi:putative salt-induced outer membrane protein YdiY